MGDRWYADVPLAATNTTGVIISFQSGALVATNSIAWIPLNLIGACDLAVRKGDSLSLTAFPSGATNGSVTITVSGITNYVTSIDVPVAHTFSVAGVYTVIGSFDNGMVMTNSIQVKVVEAAFSNSPACWFGRTRQWTCPLVPSDAAIDYDERMTAVELDEPTNGGRRFQLTIDQPESRHMIARLNGNGPVLDAALVNGFRLCGTWETYNRIIQVYPDGSRLAETLIIQSPVLSDVAMHVQIIVGGVTFEDGTTAKTLSAADFDDLGQYRLRFIMAPGVPANCYTLFVNQGPVDLGEY